MRTLTAQDVNGLPRLTAWIFAELGDGKLYPCLSYDRSSGWLRCTYSQTDVLTHSFMVCADAPVYVFESDDERVRFEATMKQRLADRRAARSGRGWNRPRFDESQCGGAFDGFNVTSDADPGL